MKSNVEIKCIFELDILHNNFLLNKISFTSNYD